jgi:hypothetical protein
MVLIILRLSEVKGEPTVPGILKAPAVSNPFQGLHQHQSSGTTLIRKFSIPTDTGKEITGSAEINIVFV